MVNFSQRNGTYPSQTKPQNDKGFEKVLGLCEVAHPSFFQRILAPNLRAIHDTKGRDDGV